MGNGAATVSDNTISGYQSGVFASGSGPGATSTPTIAGNTITDSHQVLGTGGAGVGSLNNANPTITGNQVSAPGTGSSTGIFVNGFSAPAATGATLQRNTVSGAFAAGISIRDNGLAVTLDSDFVTGATLGFDFQDQGPADDPMFGDVTATNITAWGNTQDVSLLQNTLTLDSSIVEDPISIASATCVITFSRGPTTTGTPCQTFQTTAAPGFVNAGAGDLHLLSTSPMIDMGNTADPPAGTLDTDGDPRAVAPASACTPEPGRRDIGADEFLAPPPPDGCFPDADSTPTITTTPTTNPPATTTPPVKKCKKGRKLKKGKCVKKKRKRSKKK